MNRAVPLGSITTQTDGRLLVVGGVGKSASYATPEKPISGVANNDTWYDDVSDGPVTAEVTIGGVTKSANPAWAVVAPPHFAPGVKTVRTLYDVLYDVFVTEHTLPAVQQISYPDHIEPMLDRFCQLQWVNHGFATQFGRSGPYDFRDPALRKRLADPGEASRELRRQVYVQMRAYSRDGTSPCPGPGSTATPCPAASPPPSGSTSRSPVSRTGCWPNGPTATSPPARPVRATRTWTRHPPPRSRVCWTGARWRTAPPTPSTRAARSPGRCGTRPCTPSRSASCTAHRRTRNPTTETRSPSRKPWARTVRCTHRGRATSPAGWPPLAVRRRELPLRLPGTVRARPPLQPLPADLLARPGAQPCAQAVRLHDRQHPAERLRRQRQEKAFENRAVWLRGLKGTDFNKQRRQMIDDWYKFGIVETHEYTVGDGKFPRHIQVESEPSYPPALDRANLVNIQVPEAGAPQLAGVADAWTGEVPAETVEAMLVQQAIQEVMEATGRDETEIAAGYLEKLDPFHGAQ